jgi:hypothetical protein
MIRLRTLPVFDAARFWSKVDRRGPDECWPWLGHLDDGGYGRVGRGHFVASRVAWELHNEAQVPEGQRVLHSCDNPPCMNPAHLWAGTQKDNVQDAISKGRAPHLVMQPTCKRGHARTEATTYVTPNGKRQCRTCNRMAHARYNSKRNRTSEGATIHG